MWHQWNWRSVKVVVADKGYDSSAIRAKIQDHGAKPVIPRKGVWVHRTVKHIPQTYDVKFYKMRNFIERLFGILKENKRIATRFDKLDICFISFVALAILKAFKLLC